MAKFHINEAGNPGVCKAKTAPCPFGQDHEHYGTANAARMVFESAMNEAFTSEQGDHTEPNVVKGLNKKAQDYYGKTYAQLAWWEQDEVDPDLKLARWAVSHAGGAEDHAQKEMRDAETRMSWKGQKHKQLSEAYEASVNERLIAQAKYNYMLRVRGLDPIAVS